MRDSRDFCLKDYNTFGIDAKCRRFLEFQSREELQDSLGSLRGEEPLVLGGGSNTLFTRDFPGTVLHSGIKGVEAMESGPAVLVRAGSGVAWDDLVATCVERGWHGAENLSLIPGEVGASAVQNIGAYGSEAADIIHEVEAVEIATGRARVLGGGECGFAYRWSNFKGPWKGRFAITHVTYRLEREFRPSLGYAGIADRLQEMGALNPSPGDVRRAVIDIRRSKLPDPRVQGNAGSFFTNPVVPRSRYEEIAARHGEIPHYDVSPWEVKIPAGWMIERCGWKGRSLGRAGVHPGHALVLVNLGGATGGEIMDLARAIARDVLDSFGIEIHPEVNVV